MKHGQNRIIGAVSSMVVRQAKVSCRGLHGAGRYRRHGVAPVRIWTPARLHIGVRRRAHRQRLTRSAERRREGPIPCTINRPALAIPLRIIQHEPTRIRRGGGHGHRAARPSHAHGRSIRGIGTRLERESTVSDTYRCGTARVGTHRTG